MRLLGRKKKKDDEEEEEYISGRKSKKDESDGEKPKRKYKKRKEPPKPWGRKERKLVAGVLFGTIVVSAILAASAREWKLPGFPRLKVPTIDIFEGETIVITSDDVGGTEEQIKSSEQVKSNFISATADLSGVYGLYVVDLNTGYAYGTVENEIFEAASLIKLPVMIAMYMQAEAGDLDLSQQYTLKQSDKVGGSGSLSSEPAGTTLTYRELISYMGQESDNTAFGIATGILGDEAIQSTIDVIGMSNTSLSTNETTPYEIGLLFQKLWEGRLINISNTQELLGFLTDTIYEEWLTSGVPLDIKVSHKYGREVHVVNDAGIVNASSPYVVVILTKGVVEREADKIFPELSKIVFDGQAD